MHIKASFTITTCARQGETLSLMISSEQRRKFSVFRSILLNCLDLTAMGLQLREILLNNNGIETILFDKTHTSLNTTKLFLTPLNLKHN